jgi:hypothetical protein
MISEYIHFHIGLGWTGVAFGSIAWGLRVPGALFILLRRSLPSQNIARTVSILHVIAGGLFLVCCIFMPITANWIWPRYGTPREIIYLIASMYIAIVIGLLCIRLYKFLSEAKADTEVEGEAIVNEDQTGIEHRNRHLQFTIIPQTRREFLLVFLKYAHALLMIYSWVMLLGAGQAFLANSRTNDFPYPPGPLADSLVGRCYGRDLQDPKAPNWLLNLTCGLGVMCNGKS